MILLQRYVSILETDNRNRVLWEPMPIMKNLLRNVSIKELVSIIGETQHYFKFQASRQVDTALTIRNWLFGYYIAEYELNGSDRAE